MTDTAGAPVADDDPFATFDTMMGAGTVRDPYPQFEQLRAQCPVFPGDLERAFGHESVTALLNPGRETFVALGHDAVATVLRDGATFSSSGYSDTIGQVFGHSILEMDEPEHRRYRSLIQQAFTRKSMEEWEAEIVRPVVHDLVDRFVTRGRADLVSELFFPFPVHVIAGMIGLPEDDLPYFHAKAVELISIAGAIEAGLAAAEALYGYFAEIIAARRRDPRRDLISVLVGAELDGQTLTDDEIIAFLRLLLPAGAETTYRSSSNLMLGLLGRPDQLDALRRDRELMPRAIEEGLRWEPPLTGIGRTAMRDVELEGVQIPAGSPVHVCLGAANHDSTRYERPDEFDLFREPQQHLAFAFGPHMCLGMHLARVETTVALDAVLDRLPNVRLDPDAEDVHITGLMFRAPATLPVVFDA